MGAPLLLTAKKGGINRQQIVGSPPENTLYDLLNGYLYNGQRYVSRPGSVAVYSLPAGDTKGHCIFNGQHVVFATTPQTVPSGVLCEVIVHPTSAGETLSVIHFAGPFLGYLFVVAEFGNGDVFYYWLQRQDTWQADTVYRLGDLVEPSTPNGYAYQALRLNDPNPLWAANAQRQIGNTVEPTVADGYYYTVVDTDGANPRSGATEPTWNAADGAYTFEDADYVTPPSTTTPTGPTVPGNTPGGNIGDRYNNPGGSRVNGGTNTEEGFEP